LDARPSNKSKQSRYVTTAAVEIHILGRMKLDTLSLQELIGIAAQGNHAGFAELYERTHAHLFGVAVRILGNGQAAEDVLQEAYVSVWKSAGGYRSEVSGQAIQPMTWLIAIVRNKALDALRLRARRKENTLSQDDDLPESSDHGHAPGADPSAMQLLEQATQTLHIAGCMNALEGSHRQSLALAYYQGLSHSEIAAHMGAPLGSVKAWIRRGLEKLKVCLASQGVVA
jgi:RNA polymerase sigma-70 factor (ECF subfamily)